MWALPQALALCLCAAAAAHSAPQTWVSVYPGVRDAAAKSVIAGRTLKANGALKPGEFYPMDSDWGSRASCFAIICAGLRDGERMLKAASRMREADGNEAAWWLGMLRNGEGVRALRALRILTEAVE